MAPGRGRGGFRGRGRGRGRGASRAARGSRFTGSRIEDASSEDEHSERGPYDPSDSELDSDDAESSQSEDEGAAEPAVRPFNALLQSFEQEKTSQQPRRKKRKIAHEAMDDDDDDENAHESLSGFADDLDGPLDPRDDDMAEEATALEVIQLDEEEDLADPFEMHFANPDDTELAKNIKAVTERQWSPNRFPLASHGKYLVYQPGIQMPQEATAKRSVPGPSGLKLKRKLASTAQHLMPEFDALEQVLAPSMFNYQDVLLGSRTVRNAPRLRQLTSLHALNHIFKTRDRIIKNTARISRNEDKDEEDAEYRDQGFTRPKVLILLETRQACSKVVDAMISLCEPEQQENKKRFQDAFFQSEDKFSDDRPEDFRELFEGNDDNEFRIGLKFTRKSIKFFSQFYSSDIILASPLGLRRAIESKGPKKQDHDFLSSIEMVIMDQADAILMQNWDHVEFVFERLNLHPKDLHGCDIGRVRNWYLDGNSAFLRQTIILSGYITPELNSLFNKHMRNVAGKFKYQPEYEGAITNIGLQVKQTFSRYLSTSPASDPEFRFKYFTTAIVPAINRYPKPPDGAHGILIFVPSYLDFVRVRNYFINSQETQNISFGSISEYTEMPDVRRARSHFISGKHSVLLYTGRAHHFRRYNLKGVKRIIMYGLPENPIFYQEIIGGFLGSSIDEGQLDSSEGTARVIFSKWDSLKLERIVGTKRVGGMLRDKGGDTFDFV